MVVKQHAITRAKQSSPYRRLGSLDHNQLNPYHDTVSGPFY